ncbi:hypothetical protein B0H10DRAFT_1094095 [Mycena sp. CBHHK59/15]|nr:hypothetical protein B0H10DRAFT_1094095 [Mycena sp. CBHHK59/15]
MSGKDRTHNRNPQLFPHVFHKLDLEALKHVLEDPIRLPVDNRKQHAQKGAPEMRAEHPKELPPRCAPRPPRRSRTRPSRSSPARHPPRPRGAEKKNPRHPLAHHRAHLLRLRRGERHLRAPCEPPRALKRRAHAAHVRRRAREHVHVARRRPRAAVVAQHAYAPRAPSRACSAARAPCRARRLLLRARAPQEAAAGRRRGREVEHARAPRGPRPLAEAERRGSRSARPRAWSCGIA